MAASPLLNMSFTSGYSVCPSAPCCTIPSSKSCFHTANALTKSALSNFASPFTAL